MQTSFYSEEELRQLGLKSYGKDVMISKKCSFYSIENISVGNHVRIDDFCILSGSIVIGNYVHISAYCALYGKYGIQLGDYSNLSPRCTLFSATDDFSGEHLVGSTIPMRFICLRTGKINIERMANVGAGTIIMPSVTINEGAAIGALSFVDRDIPSWTIWINKRQIISQYKQRLHTMNDFATILDEDNNYNP